MFTNSIPMKLFHKLNVHFLEFLTNKNSKDLQFFFSSMIQLDICITLFLVSVVKQKELCLVTDPLSSHFNFEPNNTGPTSSPLFTVTSTTDQQKSANQFYPYFTLSASFKSRKNG